MRDPIVFKDTTSACKHVAQYIIRRINNFAPTQEKPFVLGLPTGSSPEKVYAFLVQAYNEGKVDFSNVVTFNMDEYVGLTPENPQSYNYFMHHHFFDHVNIKKSNIHILNGLSENLELECAQYEKKIKQYGGIHLFLGGIGAEGHIAFNEIGSPVTSITRKISLAQSTIDANSRFFDRPEDVPKYAISVGISTILAADEVLILAFGKGKAKAVRRSLLGPVTDQCPGSFMRFHEQSQFILDSEAADEYLKNAHPSLQQRL